MGMDQTVSFPTGGTPSWQNVRDLLAARGVSTQVRMIDGELAFPDEKPPEDWRELRIASAEGVIVTVKREPDAVKLIVWGNADVNLGRAWNALTWAFAEAGNGHVATPQGPLSSAEYSSNADLPPVLRGNHGGT